MTNYNDILDIVKDFLLDNIDKVIGELTINEISQLVDDIDNKINIKKVNK